MQQTTRHGLQERQSTPLALTTSAESLNATGRYISPRKGVSCSKSVLHWGSGYNSRKGGSLSAQHTVFVLGVDGKPLTPTTPSRARKMMRDKVAEPVWNKFGRFGIQMLVDTVKTHPYWSGIFIKFDAELELNHTVRTFTLVLPYYKVLTAVKRLRAQDKKADEAIVTLIKKPRGRIEIVNWKPSARTRGSSSC